MTTQMIITIGILIFLIIMMFWHKIPYGLTAMICCVAFVVFGIADIPTAFAGFSNSTTIMIACMVAVAGALGQTTFVRKLKQSLNNLKDKNGMLLLLAVVAITFVLSQFMGQTEVMTIMLVFISTMADDGTSSVTPARILMITAIMNTMWLCRVPVGMGATFPGLLNSFYSGIATSESQLLGITDWFTASLIPGIVGTIYCIFAYKLIPSQTISKEKDELAESKTLPRSKEVIVYAVFIAIILGFMMTGRLSGNIINIIPAIGVLVIILTNTMPLKEVVGILTGDLVFMLAGMNVISGILSSTGVGDLIGRGVLNLLGGSPSALMVVVVFAVVATLMTNFLSNMATLVLLVPIAASTAITGGFNVKTIVLIVGVASMFAFAFPTGSTACLIAYGKGNFNIGKTLRFTLPLIILEVVSLIVSVMLFYPVFA